MMQQPVNIRSVKKFGLPPPNVYHYCSIESFLSILVSAEIFLSHSSYTNDYAESKWIKEIILKAEHQFDRRFDAFYIKKIFDFFARFQNETYVACFSSEKDSLSQWRAYGDQGYGVCIGFDSGVIKRSASQSLQYNQVQYYEEAQIIETTKILMRYIPYEDVPQDSIGSYSKAKYYSKNTGHNIAESFLALRQLQDLTVKDIFSQKQSDNEGVRNISECVKKLLPLSSVIKNPEFHEEKEFRLCYLPKMDQSSNNPIMKELRHRHRDRKIIPYHSFNFLDFKNIIKEIVLGPCCKLDRYVIRSLLANNGYKKVAISKSKATLR